MTEAAWVEAGGRREEVTLIRIQVFAWPTLLHNLGTGLPAAGAIHRRGIGAEAELYYYSSNIRVLH